MSNCTLSSPEKHRANETHGLIHPMLLQYFRTRTTSFPSYVLPGTRRSSPLFLEGQGEGQWSLTLESGLLSTHHPIVIHWNIGAMMSS